MTLPTFDRAAPVWATPASLLWLLAFAGCGESPMRPNDDGGGGLPAPTAIVAVSGDAQAAVAGGVLPAPFVVLVTDADGAAVEGVTVAWTVTAGAGVLSAEATTTDADGEARVVLTLGPAKGDHAVQAAVVGLTGSPVVFHATATGIPTVLELVSGDRQNGTAGEPLEAPFVVRVADDDEDAVEGVAVTWSVIAGGGVLSTETTTTDADGEAEVVLTLGPAAGAHVVQAAVEGLTGSPVAFDATAMEPASRLELVSGDGQNGKTGEPLEAPFLVRAVSESGAPVAGVEVQWVVTSGTGFVLAATSTTNAQGLASNVYFARPPLGPSTVTAEVPGLDGSPVVFSVQTTVWVVVIIGTAFSDWNGANAHTIAVGDTIEWVNADDPAETGGHTVTSSGAPAGGAGFNSGPLDRFGRFRFVPQVAGTWDYFCEIHGAGVMSGTLTAQ